MRRTKTITIPGSKSDAPGSRDNGKSFLITEMGAMEAEAWAIESLLALTNAGAQLPDSAVGIAGLAMAGLTALERLPYAAAAPLLARMIPCIQYIHTPVVPPQPIYPGDACQVEEVGTLALLRKEVFLLHTDFYAAGATPK